VRRDVTRELATLWAAHAAGSSNALVGQRATRSGPVLQAVSSENGERARRAFGGILRGMAQPKPTPDPVLVPEALKPLVEQLAKLSEDERHLVVNAAERTASRQRLRALTTEDLRRLSGVVAMGGNAVEDSDALYDG